MTKIFIKTYGCSMNQADSETMEALLSEQGHQIVGSEDEAELVLYNTCTVKDPTQSKFFDELEKTKKTKKVIVAGCIAQAQPHLFKDDSLIGVEQLSKVSEAVSETMKGSNVIFLRRSKEERVLLPSIRQNEIIEIIPINKGCSGKCTYCKTKAARGILRSFPLRDIVSRANKAIKEGVKEIWLTSQDTGAYGLDIGTSLPELVKKVAENEGEFLIRIGMTNPEYVLMYEEELIELFKNPKIYRFLHVPIQAGSQAVLDNMIRPYDIEDVRKSLHRIIEAIPDLTLATDIICGFPGETDKDWQKTMEICKEFDFPIVNISKFYKRPGTKAARMKQLSSKTLKERSKEITEWLVNRNENLIGETHKVLVNEKREDGRMVAKTMNYRQVILEDVQIGESLEAQLIAKEGFQYIGKVL